MHVSLSIMQCIAEPLHTYLFMHVHEIPSERETVPGGMVDYFLESVC